MAPASNLKSSSRFRVKKFSRTTPLSVHKEEEIDSTEYESLHHDKFDTGVEKAEEKVRRSFARFCSITLRQFLSLSSFPLSSRYHNNT